MNWLNEKGKSDTHLRHKWHENRSCIIFLLLQKTD